LLSQLNGRELLNGAAEILHFWNTLSLKFQNQMSNNSARLDISRDCLISVVGGEKLMIERENNLYGSAAPDG
jgi:hypothetical protein